LAIHCAVAGEWVHVEVPAVRVLAATYIYFTLGFVAANTGDWSDPERLVRYWVITIVVVNLVVLLVCSVRFATATEHQPGLSYFRPLAETVVFSVLVVPYFLVVFWTTYVFVLSS
jgi:protein-S-isoprenylcysteine O-methyltransferase Ste14